MPTFQAYRIHAGQPVPEGRFETLGEDALSPGNVLIRVAYSSINFKDALANAGRNGLIRELPRVGGIDLVGTIEASADPGRAVGTQVVVHGFGIGIDHDGGYGQYARVPAEWVLPLPAGLSLIDVATIGVAGYTAALSLDVMELNGLTPQAGPVAVTGATGGVASFAIDMLSSRGYRVSAITGKADEADYLRTLGAAEVLPRETFGPGKKPLDRAVWAGGVDSVGGETLAAMIRAMQVNGVVAAFGNAAGAELPTTVLPFILRGVRLLGINGNSPMPLRTRIWNRIATDLRPRHIESIRRVIGMKQLPQSLAQVLVGGARGRFVVDMQA
jgi:putative YhdH/YhfP family quinone oxidoreductase